MLIRFNVGNFRSFRDEVEFSMVASSLKDREDALIKTPYEDFQLLRTAAIYGPNAAGKTNVIKALRFMSHAVLNSQRTWEPDGGVPRTPFRLDKASQYSPSVFEVDIFNHGVRYQYGFTADSQRILEEWLYAYPKKRRRVWFERTWEDGPEFDFGPHLKGQKQAIKDVTRNNSLFVSAAAQMDHEQLTSIYRWFGDRLQVLVGPRGKKNEYPTARMIEEQGVGGIVSDLLSSADLGIVGVDIERREMDEKVRSILEFVMEMDDEGPETLPDLDERPEVQFRHRTKDDEDAVRLGLEDESAGTQTLFALAGPALKALREGGVMCIDDLDASLHPVLAHEFVDLFNSKQTNEGEAQLIFNTQDTNLLSGDLLRRDQVWFVEKDSEGVSHLYPLSEFSVRREENKERGYLQGRYGAIPVLSSEEFITGDS